MSKITITRALTELKTLDKRIEKAIDAGTFVSTIGKFQKPEERSRDAGKNYQSIRDLLERRKKIKSLIVSSNALTTVKICGKTMTIAEAIETKSSIKHYEKLLNRLKYQYAEAIRGVESHNNRIRRDLENKTNASGNEKDSNFDIEDFSNKYIEMHGIDLFDPIKICEEIKKLEEYITDFNAEVNFVLTEKNSTTYIELNPPDFVGARSAGGSRDRAL